MAKMGFETDRRIRQTKYGNKPGRAEIGGKVIYFRSKFEMRRAEYLHLLQETKEIQEWQYEPDRFAFPQSPYVYIPDFKVTEAGGGVVYQECEGYHDGKTNSKFRAMAKYEPGVTLELVLLRIPKKGKGAARRQVASKYVRRIIDASLIFRQTGL